MSLIEAVLRPYLVEAGTCRADGCCLSAGPEGGMRMRKHGLILIGLATLLLATPPRPAPAPARHAPAPAAHAPVAAVHASFDGKWSVLIVTDAGTCDRAYRYALRIADGRVSYDDPSFSVSGHVDARGNVSVGVSAGGQSANGSGRLTGDYGGGP